ncbi:MAG: hypothetical protein HC802_23655, partial [Caldilineaceae bacterium]|nr:hypothetical protein [Caldilineaceae bacterium]
MASSSPISWFDAPDAGQIIQLYKRLELFAHGEPPANTLFVLGRSDSQSNAPSGDQLLVIDPPADASQRFQLAGDVAAFSPPPGRGV